jgi:hypothetical protein
LKPLMRPATGIAAVVRIEKFYQSAQM